MNIIKSKIDIGKLREAYEVQEGLKYSTLVILSVVEGDNLIFKIISTVVEKSGSNCEYAHNHISYPLYIYLKMS
jgi:hypothetical protein